MEEEVVTKKQYESFYKEVVSSIEPKLKDKLQGLGLDYSRSRIMDFFNESVKGILMHTAHAEYSKEVWDQLQPNTPLCRNIARAYREAKQSLRMVLSEQRKLAQRAKESPLAQTAQQTTSQNPLAGPREPGVF